MGLRRGWGEEGGGWRECARGTFRGGGVGGGLLLRALLGRTVGVWSLGLGWRNEAGTETVTTLPSMHALLAAFSPPPLLDDERFQTAIPVFVESSGPS